MYIFCCLTSRFHSIVFFFFFNDTATTEIYTLSLHDALPISTRLPASPRPRTGGLTKRRPVLCAPGARRTARPPRAAARSEEHTSELQSQSNLVCRLLLEKKKKIQIKQTIPIKDTHRTGHRVK